MNRQENLSEIRDLLKVSSEKTMLSQIMLPISNSNLNEPVALLVGNLNVRRSLKKNGQAAELNVELESIESELLAQKHCIGKVIDLSEEMKKLQIDTADSLTEREVEIKEKWSEADELLAKSRIQRHAINIEQNENPGIKLKLPEDIEQILKLAEMEEEQENSSISRPEKSKIKAFKSELMSVSRKNEELRHQIDGEIWKLHLPKISATHRLVGEVVERESDTFVVTAQAKTDPVSSRIIANGLRVKDLKKTLVLANDDEKASFKEVTNADEISSKYLKKSSLFSRRKLGPE